MRCAFAPYGGARHAERDGYFGPPNGELRHAWMIFQIGER